MVLTPLHYLFLNKMISLNILNLIINSYNFNNKDIFNKSPLIYLRNNPSCNLEILLKFAEFYINKN